MKLPPPSLAALGEWRREIERADRNNLKRGRDIEAGAGRVILTSPNGTRYALTVANDGTLGTEEV